MCAKLREISRSRPKCFVYVTIVTSQHRTALIFTRNKLFLELSDSKHVPCHVKLFFIDFYNIYYEMLIFIDQYIILNIYHNSYWINVEYTHYYSTLFIYLLFLIALSFYYFCYFINSHFGLLNLSLFYSFYYILRPIIHPFTILFLLFIYVLTYLTIYFLLCRDNVRSTIFLFLRKCHVQKSIKNSN